jgi:hypothetical protein
VPLIYQYQPDELPSAGFRDDDSWWAGVHHCAAAIALAACSFTIVPLPGSQSQIVAAPFLEEFYWQNPVAPVPGYTPPLELWKYDEQIPAGNLSATVDEYFWNNPVAPIPGYVPPQELWKYDEQLPAGSLSATVDEYFWQNPVIPYVAPYYFQQPNLDQDELPAGNLSATVDEYFGFSPILQAQYFPPIIFSDDVPIIPQPVLTPDEDFWNNPSAPIIQPLVYPQSWAFDEQFPALFGQFDEDNLWQNPVPPFVAPIQIPQPWSFDEQVPALFGQMDEDFWQNQVAPFVAAYFIQQPFLDPDEIPAASLTATVDEYFGFNPTLQAQYAPPQLLSEDFGIVPQPVVLQPDEDFWQNPIQPFVAPYLVPQPWQFDEQVPVLFAQFDEDFWLNLVAPVSASPYQPLPYWFDEGTLPKAAVGFSFVPWISDDVG